MIIRIVKMHFKEDKIDDFLNHFNLHKATIRNFKGNMFLELYQDKDNASTFFTYSFWQSDEDLLSYRNSEFFKEVWQKTKIYFSEKPSAWSVKKIVSLP